MDSARFNQLFRSLTEAPSRRWVVRSLAGLALGGIHGSLGLVEAKDKRRRRDKKRRGQNTPPFCAGENICLGDAANSPHCENSGPTCRCFITAGTAVPYCGQSPNAVDDCAECAATGATCVDCDGQLMCSPPCSDPR
jgi:hypothetical protein